MPVYFLQLGNAVYIVIAYFFSLNKYRLPDCTELFVEHMRERKLGLINQSFWYNAVWMSCVQTNSLYNDRDSSRRPSFFLRVASMFSDEYYTYI